MRETRPTFRNQIPPNLNMAGWSSPNTGMNAQVIGRVEREIPALQDGIAVDGYQSVKGAVGNLGVVVDTDAETKEAIHYDGRTSQQVTGKLGVDGNRPAGGFHRTGKRTDRKFSGS